jgi:hypothetical protein
MEQKSGKFCGGKIKSETLFVIDTSSNYVQPLKYSRHSESDLSQLKFAHLGYLQLVLEIQKKIKFGHDELHGDLHGVLQSPHSHAFLLRAACHCRASFFHSASCLAYPVFMPKPSTHRMQDPESIVPHIRQKVFTDNQISNVTNKV